MATDDRSILTEAERDRIREEMLIRDEIREEIAAAMAAGTLASRVRQTVLKSSVVATLVGGLLLNSFGFIKAHYDQKQAHEHAILEKRIALISAFTQDIDHATSVDGSFRKHRLWLKDNLSDDARNDIGMTRPQVLALYEDLWKLLMQSKPEKAILAEVRCFFDDPLLPALLDKSLKLSDAIADSKTEKDRITRRDEHEKVLDEITKIMMNSIQHNKGSWAF